MRQPTHLSALALAAFLALPLAAAEKKTEAPAAPGAAMKIHVDPATGQVVERPATGTREALAPARADALPPLKIENGKTKAGGKRVRLDDRFMMQMTAAAGPDGKVSQSCVPEHEKGATAAPEHRHDR